ncbi:hypothetical protein H634G_01460 [Metarhizium anisopliae BRIP 53293]|uniref:Uncharacterized protein n=1 Tax=Metarhizium anisopliae BRIP 53293 TaxID=1291518 RepID=A0A0D9PB69_METAN|nr:hypothetical protein H634G_01460 [Metarhizium anisopliae BRIP 53293]KJK86552.1 hypothetical protein H633G_09608 [Metarhizium anisopliae BRIP 53284]
MCATASGTAARALRNPLAVSYVQKKKAAPGADPTTAEPIPRYIPEKPPEGKKPADDWSRVFSVSSGKSERSTVVPARAPANRADWKGGGLDIVYLFSLGVLEP